MKLKTKEVSLISQLLDYKFQGSGEVKPRVIQNKDRVNVIEVFKKTQKLFNDTTGKFEDGSIEFNVQECKFIRSLMDEDMTKAFLLVAEDIIVKIDDFLKNGNKEKKKDEKENDKTEE